MKNINYKYDNEKLNYNLNLDLFKVQKCIKINYHKKYKCVYFHNNNDKRRTPSQHQYSYHMNLKQNEINNNYALNKIELLYHHNFYKKKFCEKYHKGEHCELDKYCSFIHDLKEMKSKLILNYKFNLNFFLFFFKTEFCPFGWINHNKKRCVYAHNFQDFKRKNISKIFPIKCRNWDNNAMYYEYEKGCEEGFNCLFSHGWKEFCYHPWNYKINKCKYDKKNCKNLTICAYYHNDSDKRIIDHKNCFEYIPNKIY